jgi:hypothetical protein
VRAVRFFIVTTLRSSSSDSSTSHPLVSWDLVLFLGVDRDLDRDLLDPFPDLDRDDHQAGEIELEIPGIERELELLSESELLLWLGGSFLSMVIFCLVLLPLLAQCSLLPRSSPLKFPPLSSSSSS